MAKSFNQLKNKMTAQAQEAIELKKNSHMKDLLLGDIREELNFTQEEMATKLNTKQANISRTERRKDLKLSTLKRYIQAMGGELDIIAKFPTTEVHLRLSDI